MSGATLAQPLRVVDLFCGIGGVAEATAKVCRPDGSQVFQVVAAFDIDRRVGEVYQANHGITPAFRAIESIAELPDAELWWLSPPCQPYTVRGAGRAEQDPRSQALANLIKVIQRARPANLILENVPRFAGSLHHQQLSQVLENAGYHVANDIVCPTELGMPMRRKRFYLRARRGGPISNLHPSNVKLPLANFLDEEDWKDQSLWTDSSQLDQYVTAMSIVDWQDIDAQVACLTSAYGSSPVRAGSYLRCRDRKLVRRLSPSECLQLMGFRRDFAWPSELKQRARYQLIGNSLSVTVVQAILATMC
jgi:site-specific DNA-cytosine methylase